MDSVIESVLNNEEYTTNEEKIEALKKELAPVVIPKDKFNSVSNKLKDSEEKYATLSSDFEAYKQSKMTDDERAKAEKEQLEKDKKANAIEKSRLAVKNLLFDNGIKVTDSEEDKDLKETLEDIVSEDLDKSLKLANNIITILNRTKETTEKETTTKLIGNTPNPIGGTSSSPTVSTLNQLNENYKEAVKSGNILEQAQYMRLIQEEQMKLKKSNV